MLGRRDSEWAVLEMGVYVKVVFHPEAEPTGEDEEAHCLSSSSSAWDSL
jgi:hypothetical protein